MCSFLDGFNKTASVSIKGMQKILNGKIIPTSGKDKIMKRFSNNTESRKYTKKGLQDMLRNDVPNSGRLAHERANMEFILQHVPLNNPERFKRVSDKIKDFIRKNRE